MKNLKGLFKNKKGQSEVVAVLVLVAVVIVGAIGVGTIMNGFSNQVAQGASADGIQAGAQTELLTAGSTTLQPLSECLAPIFMRDNKGIKVTVQAGGSGVGITSAGMDIVDLGAASEALTTTQKAKWPSLIENTVGYGAGVFIVSTGCTGILNATKAELQTCYNSTSPCTLGTTTTVTAYRRSDSSGTQDTVSIYLFGAKSGKINSSIAAAASNQEMLTKIQSASGCAIGFVDHGIAKSATSITTLNLIDGAATYLPMGSTGTNENMLLAAKDFYAAKSTSTYYPLALVRPLNYITNGNPSISESKFIDLATNKAKASDCFTATGYYGIWDVAATA